MCLAIAYCHQRRVFHRDMKPQNVLIDYSNNNIAICDFGLARSIGMPIMPLTHEVVTLWYRAPEILLGAKEYSYGVDIWSIGCIFYEMIMKEPLFAGNCEIHQIYKIFQGLGTPDDRIWPGCEKFPDFKKNFPTWEREVDIKFKRFEERAGKDARNLLNNMMT
jgi:serine/threonine protein kinase